VVAAMPPVNVSTVSATAAILVLIDMGLSILVWGDPSGSHANWW
jgi:hypothetical protein